MSEVIPGLLRSRHGGLRHGHNTDTERNCKTDVRENVEFTHLSEQQEPNCAESVRFDHICGTPGLECVQRARETCVRVLVWSVLQERDIV